MIIHIIFVQIDNNACISHISFFHLNRLARKRIQNCGLSDRITVICTEITRDQYTSQLVDYLSYYNASFNTVISLVPSGDGLIQFVLLKNNHFINRL